jgi:tetratricopeptide (TPR) repeat protein
VHELSWRNLCVKLTLPLKVDPIESDASACVVDKRDDHDRAIADYTSSIERNSQYSDAYYNRGLTWLTKGDRQRAAEDFRQALAINPQDERALRALNQLLSVH